MPSESSSLGQRKAFVLLTIAFVLSRLAYFALGVRFDAAPLDFYNQYIDPLLLRQDLWESLYYLKEQPPLYNLFLGLVLQLAGDYSTAAFAAIYLALGLALLLCLFSLLTRFAVPTPLAFTIALIFSANPATILYENLLFYEYPLTFLFCLATLCLHRYSTSGRPLDATIFFSCLALASGLRSVFHLVWFVLLAAVVYLALPRWRRTTALALVLPAAVVLFMYGKHYALFGNFVPGVDVYGSTNFATMSTRRVPPAQIQALMAAGTITPGLLTTNIYEVKSSPLMDRIPLPPPSGIPILDQRQKSNGYVNWNSLWMTNLGKLYRKDANVVFRLYPTQYLRTILSNVRLILEPAAVNFPFDGRAGKYPNYDLLTKPLYAYHALTAGKLGYRPPLLNFVLLPLLLAYGLWRVALWLKHPQADPAGLALLFVVFNLCFLCATVTVLSEADHNRYRDELAALFALLFGLALTHVLRRTLPT